MINDIVSQVLLNEGMISNGNDVAIDLSTFNIDTVIREALEAHADLLLEMDEEMDAAGRIPSKHAGDNADLMRFERLMQAKAERQASMKDGPVLEKNKQNLARVLRNGHFLIMSANRGMNYADKDWEGRKQRMIAQADDRAKAGVFERNPKYLGGDIGSTHDAQKRSYNRMAWWEIRRNLKRMGFAPLLATGLYQESGMDSPSNEPSLIISPLLTVADEEPELTLEMAKRLNKRYNQDAFIYSGPETDDTVWMFSINRSRSAYRPDFPMGKASTVTMDFIRQRLQKAGEVRYDKNGKQIKDVAGATQITVPGDNPDSPRFGSKFGRGQTAMAIGQSAKMPPEDEEDPMA